MFVMKLGGMLFGALLVGALLVGCSHAPTVTPDSSTGADGSSGSRGLFVAWRISPQVPGVINNVATVESVAFRVSTLRVIGDAGPGDPRTTQSSLLLGWNQSMEPGKVAFASAPSGLYSKVAAQIDGQLIDDSYLIAGHVTVAGTRYPFVIRDRFAVNVSLNITSQLEPGGEADVPIAIDLNHCVGAIDWTLVHNDAGVLQLDTDDDWIPQFRQKLVESFSVAGE